MAAQITWFGTDGTNLQTLAGSGIAQFGDGGFGDAILVGSWNGHSYVSNSGGSVQGTELWNNKYISPTSITLGQSSTGILLNQIPNKQAMVNLRFTNDTAVRVQNAYISAYDRTTVTSMPSGITIALYEVTHTGITQTADGSGCPSQPTISGNHRFWIWDGVNATGSMPLQPSPGTSGLSPSGSLTTDVRHDWFVAASVSPNSISSKLWALYTVMEYL